MAAPALCELRQMARMIYNYTTKRTAAKNRLDAAKAPNTIGRVIINDLKMHLRHLDLRISEQEEQAMRLTQATAPLLLLARECSAYRALPCAAPFS